MKSFSIGSLLLITALLAVLWWRAAALESRQPALIAAPPVTIDAAAAANRLGRALSYQTLSLQPGDDSHRAQFLAFHAFLAQAFAHSHQALELEVINGASLLYHWRGSDPTLSPILLLGHMDVVPVEPGSESDWQYPPFAGVVADGHVWGRGAIDNKSGVMAIFEAIELLIASGFAPKRTVILAFGHDEEIGGERGAQAMAAQLAQQQVKPLWVLDEGGLVVPDNALLNRSLALIGTAEKGYLSLQLTAQGAGGHSSRPPAATAAGIIAGAVHRVQQAPFGPRLVAPTSDMFAYLAPEMGGLRRLAFANQWLLKPLILQQLATEAQSSAMVRTTTAPTMLRGSAKDNVLPITAQAVINFRLLPGDRIESVTQRVRELVADERVTIAPLDGFGTEPSAISPSDDTVFAELITQIRSSFPDTLVAPYLVVGATDSRHYAALSPRIYRFLPMRVPSADLAGFHGSNERLAVDSYADGIRFYHRLISAATR